MRFNEILENTPNNADDSSTVSGSGSFNDIFTGLVRAANAREREAERMRNGGSAPGTSYNNRGATASGAAGDGTRGGVPALDPVDPNAPAGSVRSTPGMNPLFTMQGASRMCNPNAEQIMRSDTLPRARRMAGIFGSTISINDAIAKAGTSRERETTGSQHFQGRALDLNINGMSNADKLRLVQAGRAAGFRGFGFGSNILHVDTGPQRAWAYGNGSYGGVSVATLDDAITNGRPLPGEQTGTQVA